MKLVEKGILDLDVPITKYLPGFKPRNPYKKAITLRQLMSHRSGLVREPPVGNYFDAGNRSLKETVESLNSTKLVFKPEVRNKYSNAGIATVGYVLEKTQKQPFAGYLKKSLLQPLGLNNSDFEPNTEINARLAKARMWTVFGKTSDAPTFELGMAPAGSMYTTTGDMAAFASTIFAAMDGSSDTLLTKSLLEQMWKPQFAKEGQQTGAGIGFFVSEIDGRRSVGHGGAIYGFSTQLSVLPDDKLGVIVVATEDFTNGVTSRIADLALKSMLKERTGKSVSIPPPTLPIEPKVLKKAAGKYEKSGEILELIQLGGSLALLGKDGGYPARLRETDGSFIVDDKFTFGTRIDPDLEAGTLTVGDQTFTRVAESKPKPAPADFGKLIGEYGPDHNITYVFEKDGDLWILIEQFDFCRLERVSKDVFNFPDRGLYPGEQVIFERDKAGKATRIVAAEVSFERRSIGPDEGAEQLMVKVVRPVSELIPEALAAEPPNETGDFRETDLVELTKLDPTIKLDVRYATTNNLFNSVFYSQPRAFLQRPAAEAVVRANKKLRAMGYGLLVHDAYRPWYVTKVFWDATPEELKLFVANPADGSRHNRGAAVDITLFDLKTGKPIEMVGTYDETTDRSYPDYPGGTSLQRWHRGLLREAMEDEGFTVYEAEWWHFDFDDWKRYRIGNDRFEDFKK